MATFILRRIDPEFWTRVQAKAASEGTTVKALILRLLTTWLAAAAILSMVGCAYHAPNEPTAVVPAPIAASVPYTLMLGGVSGLNANAGHATITATVQNINGTTLSGIAVGFTTDLGTLGDATVMTDANGKAATTLTASDSARITATAGTLTSHVLIASQPVPATPTPPPTGPTAPSDPTGPLSVAFRAVVDVTIGNVSQFSLDVTNGPLASVVWTYGDGAGFTGTSASAAHTYAAVGTYALSVTVTDPQGRRASATGTAAVRAVPAAPTPPSTPTPVPALTVTLTTVGASSVAIGGTLNFQATVANLTTSPAETVTAYQWDLDGSAGFEATTTASTRTSATYPASALITAKVTVTSSTGRTATGTVAVVITP